jgi:hypothetical protein
VFQTGLPKLNPDASWKRNFVTGGQKIARNVHAGRARTGGSIGSEIGEIPGEGPIVLTTDVRLADSDPNRTWRLGAL